MTKSRASHLYRQIERPLLNMMRNFPDRAYKAYRKPLTPSVKIARLHGEGLPGLRQGRDDKIARLSLVQTNRAAAVEHDEGHLGPGLQSISQASHTFRENRAADAQHDKGLPGQRL